MLVLEAGRSDYRIDPFIHMPAALPIPIGNRLYDWKYETDPEPHMNGRRIFHARGKVLGGSSSINGMIFQRGNPMDYERWAADPGMKDWDYLHCLPYFKRMETLSSSTAASAPTPGAAATGRSVLERGPADEPAVRRVLRGRRSRPATRSPTTSTATARRASRGSTATSTAAAGSPPPAPTCTRCATGRTSHVETLALATRVRFDGKRAVGVDYLRGGRLHRTRRRPAR